MNIAIVGAGGAVGREILSILGGRGSARRQSATFGSARSAGSKLLFKGKEIEIEQLTHDSDFSGVHYALVSAGEVHLSNMPM